MARVFGFASAGKTIAVTAIQTLTWNSSEIDAAGIVAFHVALTPAGNIVTDLDRVRIKANGQTVVDVAVTELQAFQERYSVGSRSSPGAGQVLTIPLNILDARSDDEADACQFMPGAACTFELVTTAGTVAGTAYLSWTKAVNVAPEYYSTLVSSPTNVAASAFNGRVPLGAPGWVQGVGLTTANLARVRAVLSGIEVLNLPGPRYGGAAAGALGDSIIASQELYDGTAVTAMTFVKLNQGLPANPATSFLELDTGTGAAVSDPYALYSIVPIAAGG